MISVIVATMNSAATLERCLDSLRAQRGATFEVLLSDGGSSDGSLDIARAHPLTLAHCRSGPDGGVYDAWNQVIPAARGEWLMFLGADDVLSGTGTLAETEKALDTIPASDRESSFAFGTTLFVDGDTVIERFGEAPLPNGRLDPDRDIPFSHTGLLHHSSLFDLFGLFDADFRSAGDYEFLLRTARDEGTRFHHLPLAVARMAAGGMSNSAKGRARHYGEMKLARAKLGMDTPGWLTRAALRSQGLAAAGRVLPDRQLVGLANIYRSVRGKARRYSL